MNSKDYIQNAIRTESVPSELKVNEIGFHALMAIMIATAEVANLFKRKIFYGKNIPSEDLIAQLSMIRGCTLFLSGLNSENMLNEPMSEEAFQGIVKENEGTEFEKISLSNVDIRLLHAAIGSYTESGEMIEALRKQYETGDLDKVNFAEEIGDISWYQAIAVDALGADLDGIRETNIAKLKARFPNKFEAEKALNRDLSNERSILEGGSI